MKKRTRTRRNAKRRGGAHSLANAYPNIGPSAGGYNFLNPLSQRGGKTRRRKHRGGSNINFAPYPNGLVGSPWRPPIADWPGVDGIDHSRNHLSYNTYAPNDVSRQMIASDAGKAFRGGGRRRRKRGGNGGTSSNGLLQDWATSGANTSYKIGSMYNMYNGYRAPVDPLPWKDQFHRRL